jgi:hypothetical protein
LCAVIGASVRSSRRRLSSSVSSRSSAARASSRWRIHTLPGTLASPSASLKKRSFAKRLDRLEVALAQAQQPHHRLDQIRAVRMPCDTGSLGSITASTCAAWQHCPISAKPE